MSSVKWWPFCLGLIYAIGLELYAAHWTSDLKTAMYMICAVSQNWDVFISEDLLIHCYDFISLYHPNSHHNYTWTLWEKVSGRDMCDEYTIVQ